ncbi:hypothetical protein [Pontibacter chinhatensis]|uniref:Uncharacterized protein n=1 Tax=Pontibacter chinhatensis TaxID=1436961 RepID=A0A1I2QR01_9BACT|nr:hypothetical protein [Pontibacter chinhatensis]SFG28051.1 hypothetical protein SAMN05421739_10221 [Pontibacter chinhatensis]
MQEKATAQPTANSFLEMWKHFNQMAHDSGIVRTALTKHSPKDSTWLNYYLYFNHYQVLGQTLLVYCLREELDIAATYEFSEFDLTGYSLEPEQEHHDEEAGNLRQALDDVDVLQFASVRDVPELKRTLPKLLKTEGMLKVLVLPELEGQELEEYRCLFEPKFSNHANLGKTEYVVLAPQVQEDREVSWQYLVYGRSTAASLTNL